MVHEAKSGDFEGNGGVSMERLTVFDGEFWVHKNFSPVGEDTVD